MSEPDNVWVWNVLGRHIARAFLEYCDTQYIAACNRLMPFRNHLSAIGYTRVRRDIMTMTLLEAACRWVMLLFDSAPYIVFLPRGVNKNI